MMVLARRALLVIAAITVLTGAAQMVWPRVILVAIGATPSDASAHAFGTVGMFMVLFGGALAQALMTDPPIRPLVGWATLQKAGAALAVAIGVSRGVFAPVALAVASFDGVTALLGLWYWRKIR